MTQINNANPLAKHFRQPALYIKLTSEGRFWKEGSLELPLTGELPVYPMTTRDEITLRTPDALINGTSVVEVIQSCCPSIKNAWEMPSVDVDTTLIAIRIASYGPAMAIGSTCPSCSAEHDYDVDLPNVLASVKMPDYSKLIKLPDGLTVQLRPLTYAQISRSGNAMFEEEKLIQTLADPELDSDVRKIKYTEHINTIVNLNIDTISNCTASITTQDGDIVTDAKFIREYYVNSESTVLRTIQETVEEFAKEISIKPVNVACTECSTEFKLAIDFDYSSFFDRGF
jgi:hypothetical protein